MAEEEGQHNQTHPWKAPCPMLLTVYPPALGKRQLQRQLLFLLLHEQHDQLQPVLQRGAEPQPVQPSSSPRRFEEQKMSGRDWRQNTRSFRTRELPTRLRDLEVVEEVVVVAEDVVVSVQTGQAGVECLVLVCWHMTLLAWEVDEC